MEKISEFLKQFGILVAVGLVGCGILLYGLWGAIKPEESVVEIVRGETGASNIATSNIGKQEVQIVVDVAGAVEKPGVYKLPSGGRVGDALVLAGGLSASADREWVARTVNLAEVVKDGGKIYIPNIQTIGGSDSQKVSVPESQKGKININAASLSELDSLSGIGEVRAQAIIDNRPYGSTGELVSKAKIPESVYEKIKDQVSVY